ncbi:MAG: GYF domain-containing protein [Isosphaeraceae bacterium]
MATFWHHSRQQKTDPPIHTTELRDLAAKGLITPTDCVRRSGSRRWVMASEVAGLFGSDRREWYCIRDRETFGPFDFAELWRDARSGKLLPDDQVWRPGMRRWKRAAKISGMFPDRRHSASPIDPAAAYSRKFHSIEQLRAHLAAQRADVPFLWLAGSCLVLLVLLMAVLLFPARRAGAVQAASAPLYDARNAAEGSTGRATRHPEAGPAPAPEAPETPRTASVVPPKPEDSPAREASPQATPAPSRSEPESRPLTTDEERQVGQLVHRLIIENHKVATAPDGALQQRLRLAAEPLLSLRRNRDIEPTFTILDTDEVFAFSHPGEYVYVSLGLFNLVKNDVELQFVVGVEFAHLSMRHLEQNAASGDVGDMRERSHRLYRQIAVGYTDEQVFEADAWAFRRLSRLGHPAYRMLLLLSPDSHSYGEADPRGTRRAPTTPPGADRQEVENHWRANPPAAERFRRLTGPERMSHRSGE